MQIRSIFFAFFYILSFTIKGYSEGPDANLQIYVEKQMVEKIEALGEDNSFAFVDLGLTETEHQLIEQLKFDRLIAPASAQYNRFGNLQLLKKELTEFLRGIGNQNVEVIHAVVEVISKIVHCVVHASKKNSAWVCVRASTPNHDFDVPRWHIDGRFYGFNDPSFSSQLQYKFAVTLKGNPTLLHAPSTQIRKLFNSHAASRDSLNQLLYLDLAQSPNKGEGVFFVVGDNQIGAVHSEPKMDGNRLFFSVLVGSQSEIEELDARWKR